MFGKGAKRKLDDDEEVLEGKALAQAVAPPPPGAAAPPPPPGEAVFRGVSYTLQRQTIFNISLMKLYSCAAARQPAEPRLERRVLISNVLRRIQEELRREGSPRQLLPPLLLLPSPSPPHDDREAPPPPPPSPPRPPALLTPAALLEVAGNGVAVPSLLPALSPPATPPPAPPRSADMELCPPAPRPVTPPPPGRQPAATAAARAELRPADAPPPGGGPGDLLLLPPPPPSSPAGFLSDLALDDILFADIDTSMYDFDPCTAGGVGGAGAGGGLTNDLLLKSLAQPYVGPAGPQVSANQPFKIDLTELDHIMEVLVGS